MADHTVKAYDRELDALGRAILEMGGLARTMIVDALESIARADVALAQEVVATGPRLEALQHQIDSEGVLTIARRAPVAVDLRDVVAVLRISGDLGRLGAHAESIAKRSMQIGSAAQVPRAIIGLKHMGALALDLVSEAVAAYAERDPDRARAVWARDAELDSLEGSVFRDLINEMIKDPRSISFCANVMSVTKHIERIGDHATNIAETVVFLVTGAAMANERPRGDGAADTDRFLDDA